MKRLPRLLASAALGALLPLAFLGSLLRGDPVGAAPAALPAFYIVPPALLFVMMAAAVWILLPGVSCRAQGRLAAARCECQSAARSHNLIATYPTLLAGFDR